MYHSDEELDKAIDSLRVASKELDRIHSFLTELKRRRQNERNSVHVFQQYQRTKNGKKIKEVTCSCGEVTRYKVPLAKLDDFECPRKNRKEH